MRALACAVSIFTFVLILPSLYTDAQAACSRSLRVVFVDDYVPYQYRDGQGRPVGLDIELFREILRRAGCRHTLVNFPPKRAHRLMASGKVDIMGAASITPERREYAMFSLAYREERIVLFNRSGDPLGAQVHGLADALRQGLRVAVGAGGWYGRELDQLREALGAAGLLQENSSTLQRMKMLLAGRVRLVVADIYVGYHHARALDKAAQVGHRPVPLNDDPVHMMLSRRSLTEGDLHLVNTAIEHFVVSAEYRRMIARFLGNGTSY